MLKKTGIALMVGILVYSGFGSLLANATAMPHDAHAAHQITLTDSLQPAKAAKYPLGTPVTINADHMEGMQGADGYVSGVFDTTIYAIDYLDANGNEVKNHKWIIQEEIANHQNKAYQVGDKVVLTPGHISGLGGEGAEATIVMVVEGPAYMVDYRTTDGDVLIEQHQWVSEDELSPGKLVCDATCGS